MSKGKAMNDPIAKIIEGPHLLFVGGNGHKTYGITIETCKGKESLVRRGKKDKWGKKKINNFFTLFKLKKLVSYMILQLYFVFND